MYDNVNRVERDAAGNYWFCPICLEGVPNGKYIMT